MLHDVVEDPGERSEAELLAAHADQLRAVIEAVGPGTAADAAGVDEACLTALVDGDDGAVADLDLESAAAVLALADGSPSADAIADAAREALLFGMTAGVLNVDVLAGEVSADLEPREIQGMLEGRQPMRLSAFVALQRAIERRTR